MHFDSQKLVTQAEVDLNSNLRTLKLYECLGSREESAFLDLGWREAGSGPSTYVAMFHKFRCRRSDKIQPSGH